ncbi:MAG: aldolase [Bacteriovoracaceae bacterium]
MNVKLLDCTLRDGGYYNDWNFKKEDVEEYLHCMKLLNVDIIEIGQRTTQKDTFLGAFAYSTDDFLKTLPLPTKALIGVMINAKEFITHEKANIELLNSTFSERKNSPVGLVRIAAHFSEASAVPGIVNFLQAKGYRVGVNLMQAGGKSKDQIIQAIKILTNGCNFDVLYFADSLGNMNAEQITELFGIAKEAYSGELGLHAHDNMGNAITNTLKALDFGVSWLDSTVLGMGRGAGNTRTEILSLELQKRGINNYSPEAVFPLVLSTFKELQKKYEWGPDLLYYLSGLYNIHPTYVQVMMSDKKTDFHNMISAMNHLREINATNFSMEKLLSAINFKPTDSDGSWNPENLVNGKDVLIIGSGETVNEHLEGIKEYIKLKKPVVISLNINKYLGPEFINAYAASHPIRLLSDCEKYRNLKKPLITSVDSLSQEMKAKLEMIETLNYGLKLSSDGFHFGKHGCSIPTPLVIAYSLSLCVSGNAKKIFLVGIDGYGQDSELQREMDQLLSAYREHSKSIPLLALTPTTYKIEQSSIYYPNL